MPTYSLLRKRRRMRTHVMLAAMALAALPVSSRAQAPPSAEPAEGARLHVLVGAFVGRLDLHGAGETDLLGGRAGIGFGEVVQLTGFYWRGFDRSDEAITADYAWGGELQLNLNTGFGVAPFVTGGVARVNHEDSAAQTAAVAGGGLVFPLGPVLVHAGVRDYMFGVTGLRDSDSPEDVTHNWLYSAGVTFALGRRRPARAPVAVRTGLEADRAALRAATADLTTLRDSLRAAGIAGDLPPETLARLGALETVGPRNYQGTQRIEIPIPTEGSITLRYGPEPAAATTPIVITSPGAVSAAAPSPATGGVAVPALPPVPAGATLQDPATQSWLQQVVAAQVAQQLALRPVTAPAITQAQLDAMVQRVLDGVVASVVPRLDAAQAQRMNLLREDLRLAFSGQREQFVDEIGRLEAGIATAPAPDAPTGTTPGVAPRTTPVTPVAPPVVNDVADRARAEAAQRTALAAAAGNYPTLLTAAETERGPAAVLTDAAFATGAALVSDAARTAVAAVAEVLRAHPERRVYVQGHTDAVGTELQNQRLSELRAESVRSLLVQEGVQADRIFAIGFGQARPIADNASARGRALNRRVEVVIGESRQAPR
jgi:outer membrane protein OmpA-like peptidoglycan-associated protein